LLEMGTVLYDARYMEGVEDEDGRISLYCTEFIHFIFLNGFDVKAPPAISPFDGVKLDYTSDNSVVEQNIRRLGMWREQNYFVPDSLLYSPGLDFVGANFRFQPRSPSETELSRLRQKLRGRFNSEA